MERLPRFRQCHATRRSVEEPNAKPRFQCLDGVAERRARNAALDRGALETQPIRYRYEGCDLLKVLRHCWVLFTSLSIIVRLMRTPGDR